MWSWLAQYRQKSEQQILHDTTILFILISNCRYQALKQKPLIIFGVGQAAPCSSLGSSGFYFPPVIWRCSAKPPYLSCWEPQLVLPHSVLYFSFPAPPPKGTSEQLQQGRSNTTPGGVCPLLGHCSANPTGLFPATSTPTRSCFKSFWNILCSSTTRQDSFLLWLGPVEKQSQIQMWQLIKHTELPTPTILAMG